MQPGKCNSDADTNKYNGLSPDYFIVNTQGSGNLASRPSGIVFFTITFGVTSLPGQFEFDTACFDRELNKIFMIDGTNPGTDHGPAPGTGEVDFNKGVVTISSSGILTADEEVPSAYSLSQNYPNPFNASTLIEFSLERPGMVRLDVFNILGQRVATPVDEFQDAGAHSVSWNGKDTEGKPVASGMYFYRLTTGEFSEVRKMVLLK